MHLKAGGSYQESDATTPYHGNYRGATWNTQALFTMHGPTHTTRWNYIKKLIASHDFVTISETHGTAGSIKGKDSFGNFQTWWANYKDKTTGGIGLLVSDNFLKNFDTPVKEDWEVIVKGRAAKLKLRGPNGALDIISVYGTAGSAKEKVDERINLISKIGDCIASRNNVLTIIAGDMNFVESANDRCNANDPEQHGKIDKLEKSMVDKKWKFKHNMVECIQEEYTYRHAGAFSRLDRVYSNHHTVDQISNHFSCQALEWVDEKRYEDEIPRSFHRAISFEKGTFKGDIPTTSVKLDPCITKDPKWREATDARFKEKKAMADPNESDNPFKDLKRFKEAMQEAAVLIRDMDSHKVVENTKDKLAATMKVIKALETNQVQKAKKLGRTYSKLDDWLHDDTPAVSTLNLRRIKDHALELAKTELNEEIMQLKKELEGEEEEEVDNEAFDKTTWLKQKKHRSLPSSKG